ncbi:Hypothetical predicted protein [Paramuricea clavata]|uniref:Uncharacterized protein n=1 Tax=Paramuricea clavata TaxID=317549 RepID=A0A6S7I0M1_PARCT|nr:Hypothetical predicted protein [Paramuricea clavata]
MQVKTLCKKIEALVTLRGRHGYPNAKTMILNYYGYKYAGRTPKGPIAVAVNISLRHDCVCVNVRVYGLHAKLRKTIEAVVRHFLRARDIDAVQTFWISSHGIAVNQNILNEIDEIVKDL